MSIALESGRGLGGGTRFGRVGRCGYSASPPASAGRGSSSAGRNSDSPAAAAQWEWDGEEVEGGDGEVQSSYKGSPFDTMDALQEALPIRKEVVCRFYNGKSGSSGKFADTVVPSPPQNLPKPESPSPRKRKGLLPFTFKWGKAQHKEVFPEDVVDSPTNCRRMTLSPVASSSSGSNSGSDDEHYLSQKLSSRRPHRKPSSAKDVFASPALRPPQRNPVDMRSQSMLEVQDVTDSTALVTPRDKRLKN